MTNSSSPEELKAVISQQNPFDRELVVKKQAIWGQGFPDVPSINSHVSNSVFEAIEQVGSGQRQVIGITCRGERGLGKSHLIGRIRHRLQEDKGVALFVYMNDYNDLDRIKPEFLKTLAFSLKQIGSQGVTQWQELATYLLNEALGKNCTPQEMIDDLPKALERNSSLVDKLTDKVLDAKPEIENPYIIQAIIWTLHPSASYSKFAVNWLAGGSLAQRQGDKLGLPNSTDEEREAECFATICQILDLISDYTTLVVCFDEIDQLNVQSEHGYTTAQVVADLSKDLYNSMKRGVLLAVMYSITWQELIKSLPNSGAVTDRIGERIFDLTYLNSEQVTAIVSFYLEDFYGRNNLTPPYPLFPFQEKDLEKLGKERTTVRNLLRWCQENWSTNCLRWLQEQGDEETPQQEEQKPEDSVNPVRRAYENELKNLEVEELLENESKLSNVLAFCFQRMVGKTLERVTIEEIEAPVSPRNKYVDLKIIGQENGSQVKIGVAVLQASNGRTVLAGLSHLSNYQRYDLTRGCLLRSKNINSSARRTSQVLDNLLHNQGGEWVSLKEEEIKPLVAIYAVNNSREDHEVSEEEIASFIAEINLLESNPLLLEILSAPSGEIPEDTEDEELLD